LEPRWRAVSAIKPWQGGFLLRPSEKGTLAPGSRASARNFSEGFTAERFD
jgi:hypothetical protein